MSKQVWSPERTVWRVLPLCLCIAVLSQPAHAVTTFAPYATVGVEYNSNVFARPSDEAPFAGSGDDTLGDTITHYVVGATAKFAWERDDLELSAQGERFQYNHFDELSHGESKVSGLFNYHLGAIIDGSLEYTQSRIMAPLADTLTTQLELNTDKLAIGTGRILITPEWRFTLQPKWHELDTPLPDFPNFGLYEDIVTGQLEYLGIAKLSAGLLVEYNDGRYHDITAATRYHETTEQLTAHYKVTGLSSFDGQIGFTQRNDTLINPADAGAGGADGGNGGVVGRTSTLTGSLGFHRELSVKTSADLRVFREVDSYVAGANSEIGTGAEVGIKWDPDVKISVALHYRIASDAIQGTLATADFANRTDHLRTGTAELNYKIRPWLTLRPYFERDERTSNFAEANYTSNLYGVELTARFP